MIFPLDFVFRLFNGVVTIAIASLLISIFRKTNRSFYLYWGVGYALYGVNMNMRLMTDLFRFSMTPFGCKNILGLPMVLLV